MTRSALLVLALTTTACAPVTRAPESASVRLPDSFALLDRDLATTARPEALLPQGDPGFIALRTAAFSGAPDLEAALARIDIARAGARAARAARLPSIDGSTGLSRERISGNQFGGAPAGAIDPNRTLITGSIDASWDADIFGRLRASQRAALARVDAATADAAAVRLALETDIARAVVDYRTLAERRAIIERDLASARDLVSVTGVRARAGIAPGFDLVRAQSLEADALARLEPLAIERATLLGQLATLTAQPVDTILVSLAQAPARPVAAVPVLDIPSLLLRRRPDVITAERRLAAADAEIAAAAAERFPRLSLSASLGLIALAFGDLFSSDALVGSLGAGVAGPILDFGRVGARIDQRQAEAREAFAQYRGALFAGLGETEAALGAIGAAERRATTLQRQAVLDRDSVGLSRERYRRGLDSFLTVIDAERSANLSGDAAAAARGEVLRQRIALYRAIGGAPSG